MNYAQTQASKQTSISASGVTIVSASVTTNGYPVQVLVTGDGENSAAGAWVKLQLYRDSTAIGKQIHLEGSAGSENIPYALTVIDAPSAGTYTYSLKTASAVAGGSYNFGETDGPVLTVIELTGATGAAGANGATGATGPTKFYSAALTGTGSTFTVAHGLGNIWATVTVYDVTTGKYIIPDHTIELSGGTPTGNITITFPSSVTGSNYRVVITGA
jgi:hypothetical protein